MQVTWVEAKDRLVVQFAAAHTGILEVQWAE